MKKVRKCLCLTVYNILLLTTIGLLSGCRKPTPTELHEWHGNVNRWRITGIIYEVRSTPVEIDGNTLLWDLDNVQLDLYFGWDTTRKQNYYPDNGLICFAAYFFWTGNVWPEDGRIEEYIYFDDYKNPPDAIFLAEILTEEFLSKKYEANYGANTNPLYSKPPIFNELHEPLSVTVPQEVFQKSEEYRDDGYGSYMFRFGVVPVYYFPEKKVYGFDDPGFGKENDGLTFYYEHHESDKISIIAQGG